jgi:hypothetical protein
MNILLKTLIVGHLEIVYYHRGLAPAGLRRDALPYALGDLGYRPGQRVAGDDVDPQVFWTYHHPRDFLAALVGCGLDEASVPEGIDPFCREGRHRGDPRELDSFRQNKPSSRPLLDPLLFLSLLLALLLLELALTLLLGLLLREEYVRDRNVDLGHAEADQALHPV